MTFYDQNELIAFPLVGTDDYQIPQDLLVDCIIHAPSSLGNTLTLSSISVTSLLVSVVLAIDGDPAAYLTILKSNLVTHQALPVTGILAGVSGFIAFGEGVTRHLLRLDGAYQFMQGCLISFEYDTSTATLTAGGHSFYGLVRLVGAEGIKIEGVELNIKVGDQLQPGAGAMFGSPLFNRVAFNYNATQGESIVTTVAAVFSADSIDMLDDPLPGCLRSAEGSPQVQPITSINGVLPSTDGELTLEIVSVQETSDSPTVTPVIVGTGIALLDDSQPCE